VWDFYYLEGFQVVFKTALAILKILEPKILYADLETTMKTLKDCPNLILEEKELVENILKISLPDWVVE